MSLQLLQTLAHETTLPATDYTTTTTSTGSAFGGLAFMLVMLVIAVVLLVAIWKVFTKAGKPGWAAIIPIYNVYVLLQIVGRPTWWLLLFFVPFVNLIIQLVVSIDLAKKFGKSEVFGVLALWLFSPIGYLMLAFGDAQYNGGGTGTVANSGYTPDAGSPSAAAPITPQTPAQPTDTNPAAPTQNNQQ